jgi:hypothetical protein
MMLIAIFGGGAPFWCERKLRWENVFFRNKDSFSACLDFGSKEVFQSFRETHGQV